MYYQAVDVGVEPQVRAKDILNFDYNFQLNMHFDDITTYENSSKIQIDELFLYLGAFFGFIVVLQKLIIYFYVRPKYNALVQSQVADISDFKRRTNFVELYRVHKFCEKQDMPYVGLKN